MPDKEPVTIQVVVSAEDLEYLTEQGAEADPPKNVAETAALLIEFSCLKLRQGEIEGMKFKLINQATFKREVNGHVN